MNNNTRLDPDPAATFQAMLWMIQKLQRDLEACPPRLRWQFEQLLEKAKRISAKFQQGPEAPTNIGMHPSAPGQNINLTRVATLRDEIVASIKPQN
jgi:hypothetical protein